MGNIFRCIIFNTGHCLFSSWPAYCQNTWIQNTGCFLQYECLYLSMTPWCIGCMRAMVLEVKKSTSNCHFRQIKFQWKDVQVNYVRISVPKFFYMHSVFLFEMILLVSMLIMPFSCILCTFICKRKSIYILVSVIALSFLFHYYHWCQSWEPSEFGHDSADKCSLFIFHPSMLLGFLITCVLSGIDFQNNPVLQYCNCTMIPVGNLHWLY